MAEGTDGPRTSRVGEKSVAEGSHTPDLDARERFLLLLLQFLCGVFDNGLSIETIAVELEGIGRGLIVMRYRYIPGGTEKKKTNLLMHFTYIDIANNIKEGTRWTDHVA
jgi:hypothetical protein